MEKIEFCVLQNQETLEYFGTYRCDDYWTDSLADAKRFKDKDSIDLSEYSEEFLSGVYLKIVELIQFKI